MSIFVYVAYDIPRYYLVGADIIVFLRVILNLGNDVYWIWSSKNLSRSN